MTRQKNLGKIVRIAVVLVALLMMTSLMVATVGAERDESGADLAREKDVNTLDEGGSDTCEEVVGDFDAAAGGGDVDVFLLGEVPSANSRGDDASSVLDEGEYKIRAPNAQRLVDADEDG
ncbi:MAG: hypothetical protein KAJ35_09630, partial [Thermoplasmata archaeon]|nr:hypothetical protein [Thermoplasmata archaeon]